MPRRWLAVPLLALLLGASPARAQQSPQVTSAAHTQAYVIAGVAGGIDLALITYDLVQAGRSKYPPLLAGVLELTVMTLQTAIGLSELGLGATNADSVLLPVGGLMAAVGIPLMLHAVWTMRHAPDPKRTSFLFAPSIVSDGRQAAAGFMAVGRF